MTRKQSKSIVRYCEARTRRGTLCKRPAGAGTDHVGRGPCKLHGGRLPNVRKRYAREEAIEAARHLLGEEVSDDPIEAMLSGVRVASALVAYHRFKIDSLDKVTREDEQALEEANVNRQRVAKMALDGGVAIKLVQITERMAEQITLPFEEAMHALKLTAKQRALAVDVFTAGLAKFEGQHPELPPGD
jgi:hypothetical protein